jgi:type III restriction enzyme
MSTEIEPRAGAAAGSPTPPREPLILARFQLRAVEALAAEIAITHAHIARSLSSRADVARARGTCLLVAPTGSGKTLMIGRVLESLVPEPIVPAAGFKGTVWFWFAPYSGLVDQTRLLLRRDCKGLRPRDLYLDREPSITRDGDVFVHTWGAVAANNREARRLRRAGERALSVDDLIEELREGGFFIGAVIDEAHLNFGMTARAAASFYLDHLRPDVAILATATPRDAKLEMFQEVANISNVTRVEISRDDVVTAGLNKRGLVAAHLALTPQQKLAIDPDEAILRAAWQHHGKIKSRLQERGIRLTPLLLVQVPDATRGEPDSVDRAKKALVESCGIDEGLITVHTSGQPDPEFYALANDETVEVLIFKLSAATGFDAPRAWSLVSLRPSVSHEFGLQVVGRIMRVHRLVRPIHGKDALLDRGYVFLADRERQAGLQAAVDQLKALRSAIELVADQLSILDVGAPPNGGDISGADSIIAIGSTSLETSFAVGESIATGIAGLIDRSVQAELEPHFPGFEDAMLGTGTPPYLCKPGYTAYPLRRGLGIPNCLDREI